MAAVILIVWLAAPASAQTLTFFGANSSPQQIYYQPVDTSQAVAPIATPQTVNTTFSLASFIPRMSIMTGKQYIGSSQFPSYDGMPGKNYLKAFGFHRAQPIR